MSKNIEPKLKKIGEYLTLEGSAKFVIPAYQRSYSWTTENCEKLWQDITDYSESLDGDAEKDPYFFGTVIINCDESDKKLVLIDGQQRTVTFLLLLKAMLININKAIKRTETDAESISLKSGLQERRRVIMKILYKAEPEDIPPEPDDKKDGEIFSRPTVNVENQSLNERYKTELGTILRSTDYKNAEDSVCKIKYKRSDNRFTNFFRNFKFFYNKVKDLGDSELNKITKVFTSKCELIEIRSWQVDQAIEMFNTLNSDGMPLEDSDIIFSKMYAAAADKEGDAAKEFSKLWNELNDNLEALDKNMKIGKDAILMQYMYCLRTLNRETVTASGTTDVTTPGLRRYFTTTGYGSKAVSDPIPMCGDMIKIAKVWTFVSDLPLMKVLLKFNDNAKLFLGSYFYRFDDNNIPKEELTAVLECVLRLFALLEVSDYGYSSKPFKTFMFGEELKFVDKSVTAGEIEKDFDEHINKNWTREDVKSRLEEYGGNSLVYLNEYLFAKECGADFALDDGNDIEHIMPGSGRNIQQIREDAGIKDNEEFESTVNRLGNKIVLETNINRSIGNEWFRTKVSTKIENKTGYIDSKYPLARALVEKYRCCDKPEWGKDDIMRATGKAADRIVKFIFNDNLPE